jgi:hypothetical protein
MEVSGQLYASASLHPGETALNIHCVGGHATSEAGLDVTEKRQNLFPLPGIEIQLLGCPSRNPAVITKKLSRSY